MEIISEKEREIKLYKKNEENFQETMKKIVEDNNSNI